MNLLKIQNINLSVYMKEFVHLQIRKVIFWYLITGKSGFYRPGTLNIENTQWYSHHNYY